MGYRISYTDGLAAAEDARRARRDTRTEHFSTEHEALRRARQLIEDGNHDAVAVHDERGEVIAGVLLQLRLGASVAE